MAQGIGGVAGGILGLLELIAEHQEAIEYELLVHGFRLRGVPSESLNWRDLLVLVRRWQKTPGNALAAALQGAEVPSWSEQVLAVLVDQIQAVNFNLRRGKGARPKRFDRWWEKRKQRFGRDPIPISQFDDWWDAKSAQRKAAHRGRWRGARNRVGTSRTEH